MKSSGTWAVLPAVVLTCCFSHYALAGPPPATRPSTQPGGESASHGLASYLGQLKQLQGRWQEAARLVHGKKQDEAISLLGSRPHQDVPKAWRARHWRLAVALQGAVKRGGFSTEGAAPSVLGAPRWYMQAEAPELAIEGFDTAQRKGIALDLESKLHLSQCLVEVGDYPRARDVLGELLEPSLGDDWKRIIRDRLEALKDLKRGQELSFSFYRTFCVETGPDWYRWRLMPILAAWDRRVGGAQLVEKAHLLVALFERAQDTEGQYLATLRMAQIPDIDKNTAANALLNAGNIAHKAGNKDQAMRLWRRVATEHPDTSAWPKAVYNTGLLLKQQKKYREAIAEFRRILRARVDDREPGGHIMQAYRNYRPNAQWQIGHCLIALRDFRAALAAFHTVRQEYPFQSWCGTCMNQYRYEYALYEGLCHECLGEWNKAVESYFEAVMGAATGRGHNDPTVHIRLLNLYEAAGQRKDLERILQTIEKSHNLPPDNLATGIMRRLMQIRGWQAKGDLPKLVGLLKIKGTVAGPEEYQARKGNCEAVEAARLLARHSDEAVALLEKKLHVVDKNDRKWVHYALGRCATPRAVALLKQAAGKETNYWRVCTVVYALTLVGPASQAALEELSRNPHENLKIAIDQAKAGKIGQHEKDIPFPAIPHNIRLPKDVGFKPARPAIRPATVRQGSPQATRPSSTSSGRAGSSQAHPAGQNRRVHRQGNAVFLRQDATDADLATLKDAKGIVSLQMGGGIVGAAGPFITDAGWANLRRWTDLKILQLPGLPIHNDPRWPKVTHVTDKGLAHFSGLKKLEKLILVDQEITDAGLAHLAGLVELRELHLDFIPLSDAGLKHLRGLRKLRVLRFYNARITDAGLAFLKDMRDMENLQLGRSQVTDKGLEIIAAMKKLKTLDLQGTAITDRGLANLKGLSELTWLALKDTGVSDSGLEHLKGLGKLEWLILDGTKVTGAGLKHLKGLSNLKVLYVSRTNVDGDGLESLAALTKLARLTLNQTRLTDAGLLKLKDLKALSELEVRQTPTTEEGISKLKEVAPNLKVLGGRRFAPQRATQPATQPGTKTRPST